MPLCPCFGVVCGEGYVGIGGTAEIEMVTLRSLLPDCLLWGSAASIV